MVSRISSKDILHHGFPVPCPLELSPCSHRQSLHWDCSQAPQSSSQPACALVGLHPCPRYITHGTDCSVCFSLHSDCHRSAASLYRRRVHLVDYVNLICSLDSWWKGFQTPSFVALPLGLSGGFIRLSACASPTGICSNASLLSESVDRLWGSLPGLCSPTPGCRPGPSHSPPPPSFPSTCWVVPGPTYSFPLVRDSARSQLVLCENFCICGCVPDASPWRDYSESIYSSAIFSFFLWKHWNRLCVLQLSHL